MRIVSLLPSATEIVFALGHGSDLVGRSQECDYPSDVRDRPVVMRAKTLDSHLPSDQIDQRVRQVRGSGESLYELDLHALRQLQPDVLLTQDLCGVCSVTEQEVADACAASGIAPTIVSLTPRRLEDVWRSLVQVGKAIGEVERAANLAEALRQRATRSRHGFEPPPRIAVVEWLSPPILAGLWTPDIITAAGGAAVGVTAGSPGQRTSWTALSADRPDLLVLSPCSFSVERSRLELERPEIAGPLARVDPPLGTFVADEASFSRPGPRLAEGVELLAHLLERSGETGPMPVERYAPAGGAVRS